MSSAGGSCRLDMMDDHMNDFSGIPDDRKDFEACGRH
jgi:hypothetical protein